MENLLEIFRTHIEAKGVVVNKEEWEEIIPYLKEKTYSRKECIFGPSEFSTDTLYIIEGVLVTEYFIDGKTVISRFFTKGGLCAKQINDESRNPSSDAVTSITDSSCISIPSDKFIDWYLHSDSIGLFIRKALLESLSHDINLLPVKTWPDLAVKYTFLEDMYPYILEEVPDKYIAWFLGVTPEGLSRFLRKRKNDSK